MAVTQPEAQPEHLSIASGLRVVEVGESVSAALTGMVMADYGADVLLVEPPTGSRLRGLPAFRMWARGKRTTRLDLGTPDGGRHMGQLVRAADVLIVALEPATADRLGVDGVTACAANPKLVHCEITGFGRGHPLESVPGHEGIVAARAGRAHEFAILFGGERPAFPAVPVATYGAAMLALQGIFAALVERQRTGLGQSVATSLLGALGVYDLSAWAPGGSRNLRLADVPMLFYTVARSRDGVWLQFGQNSPRLFRGFLRAIGLEEVLEQSRFRQAPAVRDPGDARDLRAILLARIRERTWDEWQAIFRDQPDVSAEPFAWPGDALHHPQLVHTGDSAEVDDREVGPLRWLGPLVTCSATPARVDPAPARPLDGPTPPEWTPTGSVPIDAPGGVGPLLRGVTVLELSTWIATPMATALLAELGARVIKIEPFEGDPMRQHGPAGLKCVQGKESIALDLKAPEGRQIVHRLVERADVLAHNYRPGVPERLGIDYQALRAINPRLIYLYAASYGSTGPMSARPAFHVTAGAVCGGALAQSGSDGPPGAEAELSADELAWWSQHLTCCNESNPDFNAALAVAAAVTMALYGRERTGEGQSLETRMMLSNAYVLSEHFVDYAARPARVFPDAGLHGLGALYRLYPARRGWVFLAAGGDRDFARLAHALGCPDLADDPRFVDRDARRVNDRPLAEKLSAVLAERDAPAWQDDLTSRGVACVEVNGGPHAAYVFDAAWAERLGLSATALASGMGPYPRYGRAVHTTRDLGPPGAADRTGAQTRTVLADIGYDEESIDKLIAGGVVAEASHPETA
jgi:crotonobetainyl-CoA:carnitine CoA-transferase CaiB-like acyl-CoA transferase